MNASNSAGELSRRGSGELEREILAVLWGAAGALTPAQVQAAVAGDLAYNTVHTILTRLCQKQLVARVRQGGGAGYLPTRDAADLAAEQMRSALDRGSDRSAVLQRFVTSLDPDDEAALRTFLGSTRA